MPASGLTEPCPVCHEPVPRQIVKCPHCGADLGADLAQVRTANSLPFDRMFPKDRPFGALTPIITHPWAVVSACLGLLACFPFAGLGFGVLAITTSVLALRSIRRKPRTGGRGWAFFGLAFGSIGVLIWGGMLGLWVYRLAMGQ